MVDDLFFGATLTDRRRAYTPFVQAGAETSHTDAEAFNLDPRCYWKGHSRSVGFGDESTESRSVVQPLRIPSVICPERHTSDIVVS